MNANNQGPKLINSARFPGRCTVCGEATVTGDPIFYQKRWDSPTGYARTWHQGCYEAQQELRNPVQAAPEPVIATPAAPILETPAQGRSERLVSTGLANHPVLEGVLPAAWREPALRATDHDGETEETRFSLICDETSPQPLACVSERYALVQMRELVSALDMAADAEGIELEPYQGRYKNGRGVYDFRAPELSLSVSGDSSKTTGTISLSNDVRGAGNLAGMSGFFRWTCFNGLYVGVMADQAKRRHVGQIDVYGFVHSLVARLRDEFEVNRIMAETLARETYRIPVIPTREDAVREVADGAAPTLISRIVASTPPRYEERLRKSIRENQRDMGETMWALAQAVSQISTHEMRGWAADDWATSALKAIRQTVGV